MSSGLAGIRRLPLIAFVAAIAVGIAADSARAAIILSFDVTPQPGPDADVEVAVRIEGLGAGVAPSVGAFDLDILFDPALLVPTAVAFGDPVLGDQLDFGGFGSFTVATPFPGGLNLFGVSLDPAALLDARQAPAFVLAAITFSARATGASPLDIVVNGLVDSDASDLAVDDVRRSSVDVVVAQVPEPELMLLIGGGAGAFVFRRRRAFLRFAAVLLCALTSGASGHAAGVALAPGDVLVVDFEAGANGRGLLFRVNRSTGTRVVVSDFSDPSQGPTGQSPFGVAAPGADRILVVDTQAASGRGALFGVDPATGVRSVLSDFADAAQGPLGIDPIAIAAIRGDSYVVDKEAGTAGRGALFKVNLSTGQRTLLSDFGDSSQGPLGDNPTGISRWTDQSAFIVDPDAGTEEKGALFSVSLATGARTLLSDFGNAAQGPTGLNPGGVAQGADGVVLVGDPEGGTGAAGVLFTVNPHSGMRTIRSTFGNAAQGATGVDPIFVALAIDGTILVTDDDGGTDLPNDGRPGGNGALFAVDPLNGNRVVVSDFGNTLQGTIGADPVGIAVVPLVQPGAVLAISPFTGLNGVGELIAIHPTTGQRVQISDFALRKQGPLGADPVDVAIANSGDILVVDEDAGGQGALFEINPLNGARRLVTLFNLGTATPHGVAQGPSDDYLVVTNNGGTGGRGTLVSVDPRSGAATLLSDFGNAALGPLGQTPESVMRGTGGAILVLDADAISPASGVASGLLFSVDRSTGRRTIVSDFGNTAQGHRGVDPQDMAFDANGQIVVADVGSSPTNPNAGVVVRIDPSTGARFLLSDFASTADGPVGRLPRGIDFGASGEMLVVDSAGGTGGVGALFTVDAVTGIRVRISDFGNGTQGPIGARPQGMTVVPVPRADSMAPTLTCPAGKTAVASVKQLAVIADFRPGLVATDDTTPANQLMVGQVPPPGTLVGPGTFSIELTATDAAGNVGRCTTTFTVQRRGDVDGDGDIDLNDLNAIRLRIGQPATGPDDPFDATGDGLITIADVRWAALGCTRPGCAI